MAGDGRLLKLDATGKVLASAESPVAKEAKALGRWLGLKHVEYERVPRGWRRELEA